MMTFSSQAQTGFFVCIKKNNHRDKSRNWLLNSFLSTIYTDRRNQYRSEKGEKKHILQEPVGKIALEKEGSNLIEIDAILPTFLYGRPAIQADHVEID